MIKALRTHPQVGSPWVIPLGKDIKRPYPCARGMKSVKVSYLFITFLTAFSTKSSLNSLDNKVHGTLLINITLCAV